MKASAPAAPKPGPGERVFVLDVPFEQRAVAATLKAQWFQGTGWVYVGKTLPPMLAPWLPQTYSWAQWCQEDLNGARTGNPAPDPTTGKFTLREEQEADVDLILTARRIGAPEFLIANDVGTGKTITAIAAAKRMPAVRNVLVICPLAVVPSWKVHLEQMGDGGKRWCVINYESAKKMVTPPPAAVAAKKTRTKNLHTARKGIPKVAWDIVITDEAHYCFPAGTGIATEVGTLPIERLVALGAGKAPRVLSMGPDGEVRLNEVNDTQTSPGKRMVRVHHEAGSFVCTADHPVFTQGRGYVPAETLRGLSDGLQSPHVEGVDVLTSLLSGAVPGQDDQEALRHVPDAFRGDLRHEGVLGSVSSYAAREATSFRLRCLRGQWDDDLARSHHLRIGLLGAPSGCATSGRGAFGGAGMRFLSRALLGTSEERSGHMLSLVPISSQSGAGPSGAGGGEQAVAATCPPGVRRGVHSEGSEPAGGVLLESVLSTGSGRSAYSRGAVAPSHAVGSSACLGGLPGSPGEPEGHQEPLHCGADAGEQPDAQPRHGREDASVVAGAHVPGEGWERGTQRAAAEGARPDRAADGVHHRSAEELAAGAGRGESALEVRGELGAPRVEDRHRDRRSLTSHEEVAVPRPTEGAHLGASRVVCVEVLERGSRRGPGEGRRGDSVVYNLSVGRDENYFADGVLVHNCSDPTSQRSTLIERIISGPAKTPAFIIRMSATAGSNPAQLAYLHRGFAWTSGDTPAETTSAEAYQEWCAERGIGVVAGKFGNGLAWEPRASDLTKMHHLIFGGRRKWATRRLPAWSTVEPPRFPMPVDLDPHEVAAYEQEWSEFQTAMQAVERIRRQGPPKTTAQAKQQATARMKGLAAQTRYRQKAGQIRAAGVAGFVAEMVGKGRQVCVAAEFLGTVGKLDEALRAKGIKPALFTGQNRDTREQERISFQRGQTPVIIFTPCEGFSLHANEQTAGGNSVPRVTVVAEPRWSPKKALQVEGRGHRNGEVSPVYYMWARGTVEEKTIHAVVQGMHNTKVINGDDTSVFEGLASAIGVEVLAGESEAG